MPTMSWRVAGRVVSALWLGFTLAFFAMITSAGMESMELEIGPFLSLEGKTATVFAQSVIAFGLVMLVLFIAQRRVGALMALVWSAFWALILPTTLVGASGASERAVVLVVVAVFCWSGWYSWTRWKRGRPGDPAQPPVPQ